MARNAHPTKSGPGRYHSSGQEHGRAPVADAGAPLGFVKRSAPDAKLLRRAHVKIMGRRQAIKAAKAERSEPLPAGLQP
jgi:hypothetical protein